MANDCSEEISARFHSPTAVAETLSASSSIARACGVPTLLATTAAR